MPSDYLSNVKLWFLTTPSPFPAYFFLTQDNQIWKPQPLSSRTLQSNRGHEILIKVKCILEDITFQAEGHTQAKA